MEWLWTWGGESFGYRDAEGLWTHHSRHVGRFLGHEVFGPDGRYLGEVRNGRLIVNSGKRSRRTSTFSRKLTRIGYVNRVNYVGYVMLVGHEDFPRAENF
jgi:sporulation protein YlmC with PRC-barrel domain